MINPHLTNPHSNSDRDFETRLRRYRPQSLTADQHTLFLKAMVDVVLAAHPRHYEEARNWLSVLAVFVSETATPTTRSLDEVLTDAELSRWVGRSAKEGRSPHTLKTRRGTLVRLIAAKRGAYTSARRPAGAHVRADIPGPDDVAQVYLGCNDDSLSARRGALAHALAGVPVGTSRVRFHLEASRVVVVTPIGRFPVPPSPIDLTGVDGCFLNEEDWVALKDVGARLGVALSPSLALRYSHRAALADTSLPLAERITYYRMSEDGCTAVLRTVAAPSDEEFLVGRSVLRDGDAPGECASDDSRALSSTPRPRGSKEAGQHVTRKTSRAAAKRLAAQRLAEAETRVQGAQPIVNYLATYVPDECDETWDQIAPSVRSAVGACAFQSVETARKHAVALNAYLRWRALHGQSTALATALTYGPIDEFYAHGLSDLSERSRRDYRSRLRTIAERANSSNGAPPALRLGHNQVNAGYDAAEERTLRWVALHQSKPEIRRRLCAIVGFCAGAGLSSEELFELRRRDVTIHDDGTIEIAVPGKRPRRTVVRRVYERHVLAALENLEDDQRVLPVLRSASRITAILKGADLYGDLPAIDTRRLRTTWIAWLMDQRVPLALAVEASGLRSSRTFWDILSRQAADADVSALREESAQ